MRISDWSSDVCSSDLVPHAPTVRRASQSGPVGSGFACRNEGLGRRLAGGTVAGGIHPNDGGPILQLGALNDRSEEHTSELQSLMRISYAVFCLKKKTYNQNTQHHIYNTNT